MAEELLRKLGGNRFEPLSAGLEPGTLNPIVVEVLKQDGIDITGKKPVAVADIHNKGYEFDYVITVCDTEAAERCPIFPGGGKRIHWSFTDPSGFQGTTEDKIVKTREVKKEIEKTLKEWLKSFS